MTSRECRWTDPTGRKCTLPARWRYCDGHRPLLLAFVYRSWAAFLALAAVVGIATDVIELPKFDPFDTSTQKESSSPPTSSTETTVPLAQCRVVLLRESQPNRIEFTGGTDNENIAYQTGDEGSHMLVLRLAEGQRLSVVVEPADAGVDVCVLGSGIAVDYRQSIGAGSAGKLVTAPLPATQDYFVILISAPGSEGVIGLVATPHLDELPIGS